MENTKDTPTQNGAKPISNGNVGRIVEGLTEIGNLEIDDFDMNIAISKTLANLKVVAQAYQKTTITIMKKHIKVDEKGNFLSENGFYIFISVKDKEDYQVEVDALNDTKVVEKVWTFKASDLKKAGLKKATMMSKIDELLVYDI